MTPLHPRGLHSFLAAATLVLTSANLAAQNAGTPSPAKPAAEPTVPSLDSLRVLIARELPSVARRSEKSPPVLAVLLADKNGSIVQRKSLPLTSERVKPWALLVNEYSLQESELDVALIGRLKGPEKPAPGSLWVVYGRTN